MACKVVKGEGIGVDVERKRGLDGHVHNHEALGAQLVRQDLNCVGDQKAGPSQGVHDAKQPDEEDHGLFGARGRMLLIQTTGKSPEDEGEEHATG